MANDLASLFNDRLVVYNLTNTCSAKCSAILDIAPPMSTVYLTDIGILVVIGKEGGTTDPIQIFDSAVHPHFLKAVTRGLFNAFQTAEEDCGKALEAPERHDALPHYRRAMVEQMIRHVAERFPNIDSSAEPNATGTSFHTRLRSGNVLLTASQVASPTDVVRNAVFRTTLARDGQQSFFAENVAPPTDALLYAILLYGPDAQLRGAPGFARVMFPGPDCRSYVGSGIDIFSRFSQEVSAHMPELIADAARPRLRQKKA